MEPSQPATKHYTPLQLVKIISAATYQYFQDKDEALSELATHAMAMHKDYSDLSSITINVPEHLLEFTDSVANGAPVTASVPQPVSTPEKPPAVEHIHLGPARLHYMREAMLGVPDPELRDKLYSLFSDMAMKAHFSRVKIPFEIDEGLEETILKELQDFDVKSFATAEAKRLEITYSDSHIKERIADIDFARNAIVRLQAARKENRKYSINAMPTLI